ncbi:hypothetical protein AAG570_007013 [Ranatra chinensis]|uniref:RNA-directed DNA polymerase from transposon X-element n=1 Tax=Ranatra chinensis TaxID=642074 RepID=A0ABD0YVQ4_9HEMI
MVGRLWQEHRRIEDKRAYNQLYKDGNSLWRLTRRLNRQDSWEAPPLRTDSTTATTHLEKAQLLASYFAVINNSVIRGNRKFKENVKAEVKRLITGRTKTCITSISTLTEGGSDHLPVYFKLWGTPQTQLKKPRFDFRRTDWDVFRCALNNVIPTAGPPLGTATDIDTAVVTFTEEITAAVQVSTPTSTPKPQKLELPEEILDLIRDKNKVRRLRQVHRRVEDKRAYNRLHKEVRSRISQWRSNRWDELLCNVSPQYNSLWKLTRRLNRQGSWTMPTLRTETTTATTHLEKAQLLAQHFAAINNNSVNRGDGSFNEKVEAEVRRLITGRTNSQTQDASEVGPHTISSSIHATPREIEKIIKKLKNNKSSGSASIPNTVLKHFTRKALVKLTNITNAILKHAHYPTHWKTATVIAVVTDLSVYCPPSPRSLTE